MPISVTCQDCGKGLKAPDALAGKKAKCPQCRAVISIPAAVVDAEEITDDRFDDSDDDEADAPARPPEKRKPCPMCGELISATAAKCRYCGEIFDSRVGRGQRRRGTVSENAGFWTRFVAAIVDGFVVLILSVAVGFIVGIIVGVVVTAAGGNNRDIQTFAELIGNLVGIVTGWLYSALQESSESQATVGKKMMGIRVTDLNGERISFGRASGRHFGKFISAIFLFIGYIMAGLTEEKQALHDMMAGTFVVRD